MKRIAYFTLFVALIFVISCSNSKNDYLSLDKKQYSPGELMKINFTADTSWDANAWIGIIPSNIKHGSEYENDRFDLVYAFINKKSSGEITFSAPLEPGKYDIRMHDTDFGKKDGSTGEEIASFSFEVK